MNKVILGSSILILLFGGALSETAAKKDPFPWLGRRPAREPVYPEILVDADWVQERLDEPRLRIIDVRPRDKYEQGHLPGALHLLPDAVFFSAAEENDPSVLIDRLGDMGISGAETLVLCGNELCYETLGQVFWFMEWLGCRQVRVLNGGVTAWSLDGGELSPEDVSLPAVESVLSPVDSLRIDPDRLAQCYGETELCEVVDLRDEELWFDLKGAPGYRPGHIPHSLPYDFTQLLPGGGAWPDPAEARKEFGLLGPRKRDYVDLDAVFSLYGEDAADSRPGLGYLLCRLMDVRARVLCGGWNAWSVREDLPRVKIIGARALATMLEAGNPELEDRIPADFALFDIRGRRDYILRHLPGALPLPAHVLQDSLVILFDEHWPGLERASIPLVFYCYGPECTRSRMGATRASRMGFLNLYIFRGGIAQWREADLKDYGQPHSSYVPRLKRKKERDPRRR